MAADAEKFPLPERIFLAYSKVSRWAAGGLSARPDDTGRAVKRQGCANPLTLLRGVLFLLTLVLAPLFMLPMMVVRLAQGVRAGFRYGASVDVASGDQARWAHGTLPSVADTAVIGNGTAAIGGRDAGFRAGVLADWAVSATALLRQSLVSGDALCTRTFMANGLYDAHQALLELRARNAVSFEGGWQAVDATVVEVTMSPLTEQVRVRVSCRGWRLERHEPTGLTLRGAPANAAADETWSEDLAFARSATAVTPPGGGLPASRCPSCGAQLDLDPGGACRYCLGVVTAGHHDWVLVSWQREPW